jgi:hypothetical protein
MAGELPREKLKELLEKNGDSLLQDRDRCEGLLKDYCGEHRREISALVGALEERVPLELRSSWQSAMTPEAMRARLVHRLEDNRGLAPEIANYAVDAWSYALGVGLGRSSDRVQEVPAVAMAAAPSVAAVGTGGGLSNPSKAILGSVGLLAMAAMAFALLHHPQPVTPAPVIVPPPKQVDQPPAQAQDEHPATHVVDEHDSASGSQPVKGSPAVTSPTAVVLRLATDFDSDKATVGELLWATVVTPLTSGGNVVVRRGAPAQLKVVRIDSSGRIAGKSEVELALVGLTAHGKLVRISGSSRQMDGPMPGVRTEKKTGVIGHLFHHAGAGATNASASHPAPVKINAETVFQFRLPRGIPTGS